MVPYDCWPSDDLILFQCELGLPDVIVTIARIGRRWTHKSIQSQNTLLFGLPTPSRLILRPSEYDIVIVTRSFLRLAQTSLVTALVGRSCLLLQTT